MMAANKHTRLQSAHKRTKYIDYNCWIHLLRLTYYTALKPVQFYLHIHTYTIHYTERTFTQVFLKINLFILFISFWLRWVFVAAHGLSLVAASGDYSSLWCAGFSLQSPLLWSTGSRCVGFSSCGSRALECRLSSCGSRALECRLSSCGAPA